MMEVSQVLSNITSAQATLQALSALQLVSYLWPKQASVKDGATYDHIIVGAGSAGCVLASRLTEDPGCRVLLVEAGGDPPFEVMLPGLSYFVTNSPYDWNYTSTPDEFSSPGHQLFTQKLIRGRMLGGSSSANFLAYARGSPHDYNSWARISEDDSWNYLSVLPYFIKSERLEDEMILNSRYRDFHGTEGNIGVTAGPKKGLDKYFEAFAEMGYKVRKDVDDFNPFGFTLGLFTIDEGVRQTTAYSYLSQVKHRENLDVLKNALVKKVMFEGDKAVGVEILVRDQNIKVRALKEVILSAGAFNSPQLLMLSGIGPREHLKSFGIEVISDLPVGENFQDHAPTMVYFKMERTNATKEPRDPHEFGSATIVGYTALNKDQEYPDYQTTVHVTEHDSSGPVEYCSFIVGFKDEICQTIADIKRRNIMATLISNLHPKSRGRILLKSKNPEDHPIIEAGYFYNEEDLVNQAKYLSDFMRISKSKYFNDIEAEFVDFGLDECANLTDLDYWKCYARYLRISQWHYCGTCALGSVVDSRLRVKGVKNLRVVDASIFPTIPGGNTNAPTIMVAEKAADMIKEDYWIERS